MADNLRIDRLDSIRALRGIAVLLVLFSHLMAVERNFSSDRLLSDWWIIGFSGVDLFFVISGFIMVYVTRHTMPGFKSSLRFLIARVTRIYPLYWVVSFALLLVWLQEPALVYASANMSPDILRSFLLFPAARDPLLPVGWTLIHEMYFYLIFGFLLLFPRKFMLVILLLFAGAAIIGYGAFAAQFAPVQRIIFSPLIFEFIGGALIAMAVLRWQFANWKWITCAGMVIFLAAIVFSGFFADGNFWDHWLRPFIFAPAASLFVFGFIVMEKSGKIFPRFLLWVGDQSYSLYLTHLLTLSLFGRIWGWYASPSILDNVLMLPILLAISLVIGQVTFVLLERPLLSGSYWLRKKLK